jgi:hypothetical protein
MSEEGKKLDLSKCQHLSNEACGVSTSTVSRIQKETNILKDQCPAVFLPPRKGINILKTATNLDDFEKHERRTLFEFYDRGEYPTVGEKHFL